MQSAESGRVVRVAAMCVLALMVGAGFGTGSGVVRAQQNSDVTLQKPQDPMHSTTQPGAMPGDDVSGLPGGPASARMKEERIKGINDDRHKRLEDDVAKLQSLTNELKADVDKANKDELSLEVMHKAGEIEKLAHDVQSRMKN